MKKMSLTRLQLCLLLCAFFAATGAKAQVVRCYTDEQHAARMAAHPEEAESDAQFEAWIEEAKQAMAGSKIVGGVYQIPVVFHVIHSGEAVGSGTNISQAAIQSQVDVLNEDFRRILGSNGYNTHPDGADTQIEFCLAQRRPDGSAFAAGQPGVNRINYTTITGTAPPYSPGFVDGTIKTWTYNGGVATATRGWDPNKYMNIWIVSLSNGTLGYAQFPQSPIGGMGCGATATATDGVVFTTSSIGKSSVTGFTGPYSEGRTATHEIGHWLGLRHIWGDGGCSVDDYCNDTPLAGGPNYGCPAGTNSCTAAPDQGLDMIENYMDYTDDLCMNIFTNDQKQRMRVVLEGSPLRRSLINSDACTPPNPSDASVTDVFAPRGDQCSGPITPSVQLRNRGSNTLTSATISYKIDNGTATTFAWTGSLAAGASATVSLPAFTTTLGIHEFKAYSTLPNGVADPSPTYDTSSISFVVSSGEMPNYSENFDGTVFPPDLRWVVENVNSDCYQWSPASGVSAAGVFSNNVAELPFYGDASTSSENLYTPIFILPCNATAASLTFNVAYRQRTSGTNDRLLVEISQDCGVTWAATGYDKQGATLAVSGTLTGNNEYYPTAASHWRQETINLLPYVTGTSKNIRFRFRGISNNGNNIFIDDINYTATTPGEIELTQGATDVLDGGYYNFGNVLSGSTQNAAFTVTNTGTTNLTLTPPITVTGSGFALNTTFGTTTVAPGATTTFILSFTPSATGPFTGNVTFGTNDCDEGTYNFVLSGNGIAVPPVAEFSGTPLTICAGSSVTYTNLSTYATSYAWTFTGGSPASSALANPTVTYNTPGTYPVTLVATNGFGNDTETKTGYVVVVSNTGAALPLTQGFTTATFPPTNWSLVNANGSPTTWVRTTAAGVAPTTGNSMMFDNFNYNDSDDDEVRVQAVTLAGMVSSTLTFDVAYAPYNAANFDGLQVLVSTDCGVTWTSVYNKSYTTLATAAATTSQFTPTAGQWRNETVSLTPYVGQTSVIVAFRNLSGYGNRLFVDNINISGVAGTPPPVASFTGTPTTVCAGQSVAFTNTSTNSPTSNSWTFTGGTPSSSTQTNPTVTYNTPGTYNVSLTATNGGGSNTSTQNNYITVVAAVPVPTITAGGPTTFCSGGSVTLTSSSATGNVWSPGGQTTQSITVSAGGSYSVTVSNGTCSATSATTIVTVNPTPATPTITAGGPTTFCSGGSVTLTSSSASGNVWSPGGATTQSISATTSGTYTVTVTSGGCSATSAPTTVTVNPTPATPTITAGGPTTFCSGGSVTLTSSSASGNVWSPGGATTQSISATTSGTYTVTVTSGGCSATSAPTTVTVNPTPATPTITAGGPTTFCSGGSVTLTSSSASGNVWSPGGATTQSISATTSGTYTVTVTSGGCSATSAPTTVTVNPTPATPTITAGGPTTFCSGGSVTLTSSSASGNVWSPGGATTQSISATTSGTYTVTVTSGGCSATSAPTTVTVNPTPATPTITAGGPTTFCSGGSVTLTSSSASGNVWSPGGATTQSISATTSGTYTVTVTSGGCSATSAPTTVTVNPTPATPTITAGGPTTFCSGGSVTLTSSSASGNVWSPGGATTQSISATTSGTYTVTVTSGGCSAMSAPTTVTVNPTPATPTITAGGPTTFCSGGSVTLTSSSASGNVWSPGGATTQSISATTSGTYTVTVTSGGCSATSAPTTVTVNPTPATPTITAGGPTTFCSGGSVTLTSSSASGNVWSPGGATTQSISATTSGAYTVTVTIGGCSATSAPTTVTVNPTPATPTITAGGPTTFCSGGSVTLTSSSASGNVWSPGGATTQSISATTSGTYTVTVTSGGCSATSAPTTVTVNPTPATPTITAGGPTTFCSGGSVTLTSSSASGNVWSPGGATTQSISATTSGAYTVTVTIGGCSATSAPTTVTVNPTPATPTITAGGPTTFCSGGSVTLTSSSASGNVWSPGGATTQSISATTSGTYTVTVTSGGCSATSAPTTVTVNPTPSIALGTVTNPTSCGSGTGSIQITGSGTGDLSWTGTASGSMNGVTLPATVTGLAAGSYSVTFTSSSGCTSNMVTQGLNDPSAPVAPTITAGGPTTFCTGGSVTLTSSAATGNDWLPGGASAQSISVTTSGTYTVTFTDINGCSSTSAPMIVTVNPTPVIAFGTVTDPSACATPTGSIQVNGSGTGDLSWTGTSSGAMTGTLPATITGLTAGSYTITFTAATGCSSNTLTQALNDPSAPPVPTISASAPTTFCQGDDVVLTSSSPSGNLWSPGGETTQSITVSAAGSYSVTVTGGGGCSSSSTATVVTVNANPVVSFSPIADLCVYNPAFGLNQGSPAGGTYSGNGVSGGSFDPATAGLGTSTLTYTFIDGNGCVGMASADVLVGACSGIGENGLPQLQVFPNPSTGVLTVDAGETVIEHMLVYDHTGRIMKVLQGTNETTTTVDLSGVADGVYTLQVMSDDASRRVPVVVKK